MQKKSAAEDWLSIDLHLHRGFLDLPIEVSLFSLVFCVLVSFFQSLRRIPELSSVFIDFSQTQLSQALPVDKVLEHISVGSRQSIYILVCQSDYHKRSIPFRIQPLSFLDGPAHYEVAFYDDGSHRIFLPLARQSLDCFKPFVLYRRSILSGILHVLPSIFQGLFKLDSN